MLTLGHTDRRCLTARGGSASPAGANRPESTAGLVQQIVPESSSQIVFVELTWPP
jgi:hypothetical protein